jgi:pilus assembly protein CpaB
VGERSNNLFIAGAIGLALLAAIFAFAALRANSGGSDSSSFGEVEVVVAKQPIAAGQTIEDSMLQVVGISETGHVEGALTSLEDVTGSVARYPIATGAQFTKGLLGSAEECGESPLACVVPVGKRAVTVEVSEEKVFGGLLAPGDHVDVIAIIERTVGEEEVPTAIALIQNAEVLAVADESLQPIARFDADGNPIASDEAEGVLGAQPDDIEAQPEARSVTLAVSPEEALSIALAQEEGAVWLSLRGSGDDGTPPIEPQTLTN